MRSIIVVFFAVVTTVLSDSPVTEPDDQQDERRKVEEYRAVQKDAEQAKVRLAAIEAALGALATTEEESSHLVTLRAIVEEYQAEVAKRQLLVLELRKRYRIVDPSQLPAEERKKIIMDDK